MAKTVKDEAQATIDAEDKRIGTLAKLVTDDNKVLSKTIAVIKASSKKLHEQICVAAASCVVHLIVHGNSTPSNQLIEAVGEGFRRNALRSWMLAFGPFVYEARDEAKGRLLYPNLDRMKSYRVEYAKDKLAFCSKLMATTFYKFTPEPAFPGFDFTEALANLIKRGEKIMSRDDLSQADKAKVNLEGLTQAKALLADLAPHVEEETEEAAEQEDTAEAA